MPLPVVAWFTGKAFTTLWGQRMRLIRAFQEHLSALGMGRFIAHYTLDEYVKESHEDHISKVIDAYIYVITPCALLSVFGDEIRTTSYLHEYFSKWKSYQTWLTQKDRMGKGIIPVIYAPTVIADVFRTYGLDPNDYDLKECLARYSRTIELITNTIVSTYSIMKQPDVMVLYYILQNYNTIDFSPYLGLVDPKFWRLIHPTIDLDWTVIKSYIALKTTYEKIRLEENIAGLVPPFIRDQLVKVYVEDEFREYTRLDRTGRLEIRVPKTFSKLRVDTFGLKKEILREELTFTLNPIADSYIYSHFPADNYGSEPVLALSSYWWLDMKDRYPYLKFPVENITEEVEYATLRLYYFTWFDELGHDWHERDTFYWADQLLGYWDEATITWNNAPTEIKGAGTSEKLGSEGPHWWECDVTPAVKNWVEKNEPNYGFKITRVYSAETCTLLMRSRDYGYEPFRPQLIVKLKERIV